MKSKKLKSRPSKSDGKSPRKTKKSRSSKSSPKKTKSSSSSPKLPVQQILPEQLSKHARHNYYTVDELVSKVKNLNRQVNLLEKIIDEELKADNDPIINLCIALLSKSPEDQQLILAQMGKEKGIKDNIVNDFMSGKRTDRYFRILTSLIYNTWDKLKTVSKTGNFVYTLHGSPIVKGSVYLSSYIFDEPTALSSYGRTIICDVASPYIPSLLSYPICLGIYGYYFYVAGDYFFETIRPLTPYNDDKNVDFTTMVNHYLYKFLEYNAKHNAFIEKIATVVEPLANSTVTAYNISTNIFELIVNNTGKAVHILEGVNEAVNTTANILSNVDDKIKDITKIIDKNNLLKYAIKTGLPLLIGHDDADKLTRELSTASALPMPSYISEYPQIAGEDD